LLTNSRKTLSIARSGKNLPFSTMTVVMKGCSIMSMPQNQSTPRKYLGCSLVNES